MANDSFLKNWIIKEHQLSNIHTQFDKKNQQALCTYLSNYKHLYGYNTIFCISNLTKNYYTQYGFNKTLSTKNKYDSWFYNFLNLNKICDIQVDTDEDNNFNVTLFTNYKVIDQNNNVIGVVGSGRTISKFEKEIENFKDNYDLNIYIVNVGNANNSFTGKTKYFKSPKELSKMYNIPSSEFSRIHNKQYTLKNSKQFVSIKHIDDLNWNIVIEKNTSPIYEYFLSKMSHSILYAVILIFLLSAVSTFCLTKLNKSFVIRQNIDELTSLYNYRIFKCEFTKFIHRTHKKYTNSCLFMLDVDNFKTYNDTCGHLYGNDILKFVASKLLDAIGECGICARWGGDEFIGIYYGSAESAQVILDNVNNELKNISTQKISLSIGITTIVKDNKLVNTNKNLSFYTNQADSALYHAKQNGKGRSHIIS
ncbi:GGDEF domain-containing protein [Lachnobacterium bovis]|uniref:Diguanylate cyclase (GGDEF) domain-containing protein n=1 Tax=Lachnobacterium bovis TaxID=140626 RepID=A0A1H9R5U1_9FIRM|nr:GGDEF domain-containing protein [Lachnobacterium bovis]SER68221.1 diguanylate cyclase (GGDEF) domain-containing protein [Lachnobacterium bovis]